MPDSITGDKSTTYNNKENCSASCSALSAQNDPELQRVIEAWQELPEPIRAGIVAMIQAAGGDDRPGGKA